MSFHIICLATGKPYEMLNGEPFVYETGQAAAAAARVATEAYGTRYQPRRIVHEIDWKQREQERFDSGMYERTGWESSWWWRDLGHFVHISREKQAMIAFTEDDAKGSQDRQTRMTVGRYLTRYYGRDSGTPILCDSEIRFLATEFSARHDPITLRFTNDADQIEHVYTNGPNSCMSHDASDYRSSVHPTRVYAGPDLAVAYIVLNDGNDDERITARALAWPEKKIYGRMYGDELRLEKALTDAGYRPATGYREWLGARMTLIEDDDCIVCPYLDVADYVEPRGQWLVIAGHGTDAKQTDGMLSSYRCERCGTGVNEDETYTVRVGRWDSECWCEDCYSHHTWTCEGSEETYSDGCEPVTLADGTVWSERYFEHYGATCDATGEHYHQDDCVTLANGETWSRDYWENHGATCEHCGELHEDDDAARECCDHLNEHEEEEKAPVHPARQGRDESPNQVELPLPIGTPISR